MFKPVVSVVYICTSLLHHEVASFSAPSPSTRTFCASRSSYLNHPSFSSRKNDVSRTTLWSTTLETALKSPKLTNSTELGQPLLSSASSALTKDDYVSETNTLAGEEYTKGVLIIGFITLLNASLAPVWHVVYQGTNTPPPLFLNAVISVTALLGLLAGGPFLDNSVESMSSLADNGEEKWSKKSFRGGMELGFWKGLGTTCHTWGLAYTTANHGAFLLQLTTLIVPVLSSLQGERIPRQVLLSLALALSGIVAFTQDPEAAKEIVGDPNQILIGDALCVGAAFFYSIYDLQTFKWGREVPRTELVTIKIGFQAALSVLLCAVAAGDQVIDYVQAGPEWSVFLPTVLWSGLFVNALATFLQVGGMQAVGPTRAQTIFGSQPFWASIMNFVFLGEIMGVQGIFGGGAFLGALFLAATAEAPKPAVSKATES